MASETKRHNKPAITMARSEHERLTRLAETCSARNPDTADDLLAELDRARIVADDRIADDVIRMGSSLRFTTHLGEDRRAVLVFPGEADIAEGKISILTPVGAALIGLRAGQSIEWTARDGRVHRLTVQSVGVPLQPRPAAVPVELQPA